MKTARAFFPVLAAALLGGCAHDRPVKSTALSDLPDLGRYHFKITTSSPEAQRRFDRGLTLAYSFGHTAAETEFQKALAADPKCAMAYWGIALVNGPHINFPLVPPEKARKAWEALVKAREFAPGTSPLEQAFIAALGHRYADPQPEDRRALDEAYAAAMAEVWKRFPQSADAAALCAEAAMDLHPWDLWKEGAPQPWTPPILETLEAALKLDAKHPGANHYYIHAVEASPHPEKALPSARRLAGLVPDASHMVHMPAHIYARVGDWKGAAQSNRDALKADQIYRAAYPKPGFYAMYMAHNSHFLAYATMMLGRSDETILAARQMVREIPPEFIQDFPTVVDGYTAFVSEALMRFGKWEEILAEPAPPAGLPIAKAKWHFTRASALNALGRADEAKNEQQLFEKAAAAVPADSSFGNNSGPAIVAIARLVLEGEIAANRDDFTTAVARLSEAAKLEDQLRYDEPPGWIQPVRHALGAVLLRQGDAAGAEKVYRADLERNPGNGWSLLGLRNSLAKQNKTGEAEAVNRQLQKAWSEADVKPSCSCYCQERR
jgi:tetratricopeptide (TPR) repeat protein